MHRLWRDQGVVAAQDWPSAGGLPALPGGCQQNFGKKCLREIYNKLEDVALGMEKTPKPLDLESLVKYVLSGLSARHRDVICRRYGLWEGERETLEEISRSFGVTRERIRQIQDSQVKKIQRIFKNSIQVILSLEELFNKSLKPFLEANYNIANSPELLKIIYDIDDEKIGVDLANEFLSEVFFDEKPIFNDFKLILVVIPLKREPVA